MPAAGAKLLPHATGPAMSLTNNGLRGVAGSGGDGPPVRWWDAAVRAGPATRVAAPRSPPGATR